MQTLIRILVLFVMLLMESLILSVTAECQSLKVDLRKLPEKEAIRLSDLGATDIQYIPLETTKQNVLPEIKEKLIAKPMKPRPPI